MEVVSLEDDDLDLIDNSFKFIDRPYETPHTPTSDSEDGGPPATFGEEDGGSADEPAPRRKPGGYNSRIEQILYENPHLSILITDAGKSLESGGRYIVYTIRTGVRTSRIHLFSQLTFRLGS